MMWRTAVTALISGTLVSAAAPAQADDNSYISYLDEHGFKYQSHAGATTPSGAIHFGEIICQNIRRGRAPRDRFDRTLANGINQVMIDAAQHELCPDTLAASPPSTAGAAPMPGPQPAAGQPPGPEVPPPPDAPPAPELPPGPEIPPPPEAPPAPELPPPPPAPEPTPGAVPQP
ncbi:MAG TPA: DUF732 domain-containing protein [Mycobacterium sp.]|nr:DUF732 domain-containing protein [Mycobacterium sp.]